MNMVTAMKDIR